MIHSEPSEGFAMRRFEMTEEQFSRLAAEPFGSSRFDGLEPLIGGVLVLARGDLLQDGRILDFLVTGQQ